MHFGKRQHWFLIALVLAAIGLLVWAVIGPRQKLPPSQHLPDGSVVTITKVGYGKVVRIPMGNSWQQLAGRILPDSVSKRLGVRTFAFTNAADTTFLVVETQRTNGTFSAFPGGATSFSFGTFMLLADDVGNEFEPSRILQFQKASNQLVEAFTLPLVSHLATQFDVRLAQYDVSTPSNQSIEFTLPNPAPRAKTRWTPGRLPLTNQMDGLTIVLSAIQPGWSPSGFFAGKIESPSSSAEIQIFEGGAPSTNWTVTGFEVQDEEGNVSGSGARFSPQEPRKFIINLNRLKPSSPDDVLTLHDVVVLDPSNNVFTPVSTNFQGHNLRITRFTRGQIEYNLTPELTRRSHRLTIAYTDESEQRRIAVDEYPGSAAGMNMGFGPPIPDSVKTADLILSFTTNRTVEFLAYPGPASYKTTTNK